MNYYVMVLKRYADFNGRSRRSEYWYFALFNIIISFVLGFIDGFMGMAGGFVGVLSGIYALVVLIPGIAVSVRRLHDVGKSGWMLLIGLIPVIGIIWLLVLFLTDSKAGSNEYGDNPKEVSAA